MKTLIVIPTYWAKKGFGPVKRLKPIFDHPTPIDEDGTLMRAIESLRKIGNGTDILVLASAFSKKIEKEMNDKLIKKLDSYSKKYKLKLYYLSSFQLDCLKKELHKFSSKYDLFLGFKGYSRVRNLSLLIAQVLDEDILISIDDDEYVTDPKFLAKAKEFIGKEFNEKRIDGISGYCHYGDGRYKLKIKRCKWSSAWNQAKKMNQAFDKFIGKGPRLKDAHFMLTGCAVLHKNLFKKVPFDYKINRGEDSDYLINAKMFGFNIFFDNEFWIMHDPPSGTYPLWKTHRSDIYRFIYEREKLRQQKRHKGMKKVKLKDLSPYISAFLGNNLDNKIKKSSEILYEQYSSLGDGFSASECLRNIELAKTKAMPKYDVFKHMLRLQRKWESFSNLLSKKEVKKALKKCLIVFDYSEPKKIEK
ncbi:hypothetical protein ACFLZ7_02730 [Nanoarchaeota archaeon]